MSSPRKIILRSSDGEPFEVDEAVAFESQIIKHLIEDDCTDNGILLPNVTSRILAKVIEYSKKHVEARLEQAAINHRLHGVSNRNAAAAAAAAATAAAAKAELYKWDAEFVKVDQATLYDLMLAADYLNIKGLLDLICQTVADTIKRRTPKEIRKQFTIKNDFTPEEEEEEEEEVRRENQWAFE